MTRDINQTSINSPSSNQSVKETKLKFNIYFIFVIVIVAIFLLAYFFVFSG